MITEVFPDIYKENYNLQNKIEIEEEKSKLIVNELKNKVSQYKYRDWPLIGACAGFALGVLVLFEMGIGKGLTYFVVFWISGAIIGSAIYKKNHQFHIDELEKKCEQIEQEKTNLTNRIEKLKKDQINDFEEYSRQFEINANEKCKHYNESNLVKDIVIWITKGLFKHIDNADRGDSTKNIKIELIYCVFSDCISSNLDAELFRIDDKYRLQSNLEQVALSKAIAEEIDLYVLTSYPNDISGAPVDIIISTQYMHDHPKVIVTYSARNANFII